MKSTLDWQRLNLLFDAALHARDAQECEALLLRTELEDPQLAAELRDLLQAHREADRIFEQPLRIQESQAVPESEEHSRSNRGKEKELRFFLLHQLLPASLMQALLYLVFLSMVLVFLLYGGSFSRAKMRVERLPELPQGNMQVDSCELEARSKAGMRGGSYPIRDSLIFETLSMEDGLSHDSVYEIAEDQEGFLWIASLNGLNRYDGQSFQIFRHQPDQPASLAANKVTTVLVDANNRVWVGTAGGLNRFRPTSQDFESFQHRSGDRTSLSHNSITCLYQHGGSLWVGTANGLNRFDPQSGGFERIGEKTLSSQQIRSLAQDRAGNLWVATVRGLNRIAPDGKMRQFLAEYECGLATNNLNKLFLDKQDRLWVGTRGGGLSRYLPEQERFFHYETQAENPDAIGDPQLTCFLEDHRGQLWIGSWSSGLFRYLAERDAFERVGCDDLQSNGLLENRILSLMEDRTGNIWLSGYFGINKIRAGSQQFAHYGFRPGQDLSLSESRIRNILEDPLGRLWIGTEGSGLNCLDRVTRQNKILRHEPKRVDSLSDDRVRALLLDRGKRLWVGTRKGLNRLEGANAFSRYGRENLGLSSSQIRALAQGTEGRIWVGTIAGLDLLRASAEDFGKIERETQLLQGNAITDLQTTAAGTLWVGTEWGLFQISENGALLRSWQDKSSGLESSNIADLHLARDGVLWIGTASGLHQLDPLTGNPEGRIRRRLDAAPLAWNIFGIEACNGAGLWLSTDQGLFHFEPQTGVCRSLEIHPNPRKRLFMPNAHYRSPSGELFFGTSFGLHAFRAEGLEQPIHEVSLALNSLYLGGSQWDGSQNQVIPFKKASLQASFSILDHRDPRKKRYAYLLEGYDENWHLSNTPNLIQYNQLQPGNYRLRLNGAGASERWRDTDWVLAFRVSAPWWGRFWFRAGLLLVFSLLLQGLLARLRELRIKYQSWLKGRFIGPFRILETLGSGGSGTVYKAIPLGKSTPVAVKVLHESEGGLNAGKRFLREEWVCSLLQHPSIIQIYDRGAFGGRLYFSMEYIAGKTLRGFLNAGWHDPRAALELLDWLAELLCFLHERGFIHRDLKPENIIFRSERMPEFDWAHEPRPAFFRQSLVLLDFGLAKAADFTTLTRDGMISGTLSYLPPEYLRNPKMLTPSLDYYALGVLFYECLTGKKPFQSNNLIEFLESVLEHEPPRVGEIAPHLPVALAALADQMICKDPQMRLNKVQALKAAIEKARTAF